MSGEVITYQDLQNCTTELARQDFVFSVIERHKGSKVYKTSKTARQYLYNHNPSIERYERLLYTVSGKSIVDDMSPNHKLKNGMFNIFVTQQVQFLLGNGISWDGGKQPDGLGDDFEIKVQKAAREACVGGAAYGFYNLDHIEVFTAEEYVPLPDEKDGAHKAGIRHWQIDSKKPMRATLYELDGYTEYMWESGKCEILQEKRPYIINYRGTDVDGMKIYSGENYPGFPIVPLYAQESHESLLVGHQESLDAYDLIKSGYANTVDGAGEIFWIIQNAGGMDDVDVANFLNRVRRTHAALVDEDGAKAEPHTLDAPFQARESILVKLERDLYRDFMAFDPRSISGGSVTATEILASYEPLNSKEDEFEFFVTDFIKGILEVAGIQDEPAYTRSMIVNKTEEIDNVLKAASYLSSDYVTKKILTILGDADLADDILEQMAADELERMSIIAGIGQTDGFEAGETGEESQEDLPSGDA